MASQTDNTPTAVSENDFTRSGYTFVDWNTDADGSGKSVSARSTYSFKKSVTLYAQWKKVPAPRPHIVTFVANGGSGAMPAERTESLHANWFHFCHVEHRGQRIWRLIREERYVLLQFIGHPLRAVEEK
jgi:uncharacterized repeat protein (TIGR02543 family)